MATISTVLAFARAQTQTDSNGITDTNGIVFANEALLDFRRELQTHNIDASQIVEAYRDATAGTGTYLYPTDMFSLKAIELRYGGSTDQDYKTAKQIDQANTPNNTSFSWLRVNADPYSPQFADNGDYYEIFPTPVASTNLSQMIRIIYFQEATEYTTTADTISYPESLDYRVLGWRIAATYLYSLFKINEGDKFMVKYQERVKQLIESLGRGVQTPLQAVPMQISGWEF